MIDGIEPVDVYTNEVVRHIYAIKERLPKDYPLVTDDRDSPLLYIVVPMQNFAYRPVEERLAIALELEKLKTLIKETGILCEIEKIDTRVD